MKKLHALQEKGSSRQLRKPIWLKVSDRDFPQQTEPIFPSLLVRAGLVQVRQEVIQGALASHNGLLKGRRKEEEGG